MKIITVIEVRPYKIIWCHNKCEKLKFMAQHCQQFGRRLYFDDNGHYRRCDECMEAKRV